MLPKALPNARILTWGYNANVHSFMGSTSSDTILEHAHTLIAQLQADREVWLALVPKTDYICFASSQSASIFVYIISLFECSLIDLLNWSHVDGRRFREAHHIHMPFTWGYHRQKGIVSTSPMQN